MAEWTYIITNLDGSNPAEIVDAHERKTNLNLNRLCTAQVRLNIGHRLVDRMLGMNCLLKTYRNDTLAFVGPLTTAEEDGSDNNQTVMFTASDPLWRLAYRYIGKSQAGYADTLALKVKGTIAKDIIEVVNAENISGPVYAHTGITTHPSWITDTGVAKFGPVYFKDVASVLAEFSATLNGFDFWMKPIEPENHPSFPATWIAEFRTYNLRGTSKDNLVFEYGTSKANVGTYKRTTTMDGLMNFGYNTQGHPEKPALYSYDSPSFAKWGRFEGYIAPDVTDATLRQDLIDQHVAVRRNPRTIVLFTPYVNAKPYPIAEYMPGDRVHARAVVQGSQRFDGMFRIWGMTMSADDNGNETTELQLVPE